jgi:cell division protein FtsW (lipid II flippase)
LLTLFFGKTVNGSRNWIDLGPIAFQPSEIIKILYIMFLACKYSGSWNKPLFKVSPTIMTGIVTYLYILFLVFQRDWGTILVVFLIFIFMIYVYEDVKWFLPANIAAAVIVGILGYLFLYHIKVRVGVWLNPWEDVSNKGYQIAQSLFAIASGGYFGRGLGNGTPDYIPEVHTDFIFSAICEEMGVFGGAAVIILYFLFAYRCFKITLNTQNSYNKAVGLGLTLMFAVQTFIIIGGVIKFIPLTGITLPFISYGGTSIVVSFASLGIMQAISALEARKGGGREDDE